MVIILAPHVRARTHDHSYSDPARAGSEFNVATSDIRTDWLRVCGLILKAYAFHRPFTGLAAHVRGDRDKDHPTPHVRGRNSAYDSGPARAGSEFCL